MDALHELSLAAQEASKDGSILCALSALDSLAKRPPFGAVSSRLSRTSTPAYGADREQ